MLIILSTYLSLKDLKTVNEYSPLKDSKSELHKLFDLVKIYTNIKYIFLSIINILFYFIFYSFYSL